MIATQPLATILWGTLIMITFFSGSNASAGKSNRDTVPSLSDTAEIKRYAEQKIEQMLDRSVDKIDSLKTQLLDSVKEQAYTNPHKVQRYRRYVDIEKRPNGRVYKWSWWYWIVKYRTGQRDTVWDKMIVERVQ